MAYRHVKWHCCAVIATAPKPALSVLVKLSSLVNAYKKSLHVQGTCPISVVWTATLSNSDTF